MKRPAHRPTTYDPKYCEDVDTYIKKTQDDYLKLLKKKGENFEEYDQQLKVDLPCYEGLAQFIDVPLSTMEGWGRKHEEFSSALARVRQEQKKRLINMGLSGEYNSTIAKLILSANHGMSEKSEVKYTEEESMGDAFDPDVEEIRENLKNEFREKMREQIKKKWDEQDKNK